MIIAIFALVVAVLGTAYWYKTHTVISTGPEAEAKGCLSVFATFFIAGIFLAVILIGVLASVFEFIIDHWIIFGGIAAVLVGLMIMGKKQSDKESQAVAPTDSEDSDNYDEDEDDEEYDDEGEDDEYDDEEYDDDEEYQKNDKRVK